MNIATRNGTNTFSKNWSIWTSAHSASANKHAAAKSTTPCRWLKFGGMGRPASSATGTIRLETRKLDARKETIVDRCLCRACASSIESAIVQLCQHASSLNLLQHELAELRLGRRRGLGMIRVLGYLRLPMLRLCLLLGTS